MAGSAAFLCAALVLLAATAAAAEPGRKLLATTAARTNSEGGAHTAASAGGLSTVPHSAVTTGHTGGTEASGETGTSSGLVGPTSGILTAAPVKNTGGLIGTSRFGTLTSTSTATPADTETTTATASKPKEAVTTTSAKLDTTNPLSAQQSLAKSIITQAETVAAQIAKDAGLAKKKKEGGVDCDPILTGFDRIMFMFFGAPKAIYSLLSQQSHQVSMKLKEAPKEISDFHGGGKRIGTYMDALSFRFKSHDVLVELDDAASALTVAVDGRMLRMSHGEVAQTHLIQDTAAEDAESGATLSVHWDTQRQGVYKNVSNIPVFHSADGADVFVTEFHAVELITDLVRVLVWRVPYGTWHSDVGMAQPSYLNIRITMLKEPAGPVEGIIGETYERAVANGTPADTAEGGDLQHTPEWLWTGKGSEADYEMPTFTDVAHKFNAFAAAGAARSGATSRRLQAEGAVAFPLAAEIVSA